MTAPKFTPKLFFYSDGIDIPRPILLVNSARNKYFGWIGFFIPPSKNIFTSSKNDLKKLTSPPKVLRVMQLLIS